MGSDYGDGVTGHFSTFVILLRTEEGANDPIEGHLKFNTVKTDTVLLPCDPAYLLSSLIHSALVVDSSPLLSLPTDTVKTPDPVLDFIKNAIIYI